MAERTRDARKAKQAILDAAIAELCASDSSTVTVEAVAKRSNHAKGLVLYHFKTKRALFETAGRALAISRADRWTAAFKANTPPDAIDQTWTVLTQESNDGVALAWASLLGPNSSISDRVVKELAEGFAGVLGQAGFDLFEAFGTTLTVDRDELGWLLSSIVTGIEAALLSGADSEALNGAYTAAWLGVLSLARS